MRILAYRITLHLISQNPKQKQSQTLPTTKPTLFLQTLINLHFYILNDVW